MYFVLSDAHDTLNCDICKFAVQFPDHIQQTMLITGHRKPTCTLSLLRFES